MSDTTPPLSEAQRDAHTFLLRFIAQMEETKLKLDDFVQQNKAILQNATEIRAMTVGSLYEDLKNMIEKTPEIAEAGVWMKTHPGFIIKGLTMTTQVIHLQDEDKPRVVMAALPNTTVLEALCDVLKPVDDNDEIRKAFKKSQKKFLRLVVCPDEMVKDCKELLEVAELSSKIKINDPEAPVSAEGLETKGGETTEESEGSSEGEEKPEQCCNGNPWWN